MPKKALINQVPFDFQSIETEILCENKTHDTFGLVEGLEAFDYSVTINRTKFYGRSVQPIAITEGDATYDGKIVVDRYWFNYIVERSQELAVAFIDIEMKINLTYSGVSPGQRKSEAKTYTDTLKGVRFRGINAQGSHGPDPLKIEMPLDIMNVYWNGFDVLGNRP